MLEFFSLTMKGMRPMSAKHKLVDPAETAGYARPMFILACENDVAVDPRRLRERVESSYPHAQFEVLPGSKHSPALDDATRRMLADKVSGFLTASERESLEPSTGERRSAS